MTDRDAQRYAGMTVNERLVVSGRLAAWDAAVRARNREKMIAILKSLGVCDPARTADATLADPARYGY
jgi:hypothetical protein